jgi:phosphosulfolactate synthase
MAEKAWQGALAAPCSGREMKPRTTGLTMVIDKGLGKNAVQDLLQTAGDYIDIIKLTFGTSAFYDRKFLLEKNRLITAAGVDVMPGGTFLEVALWQKKLDVYLATAYDLGFTAIEVSDGTIEVDRRTRSGVIGKCLAGGFKVLTEVGKKDPAEAPPIGLIHGLIKEDIAAGALKVIIEAREAGRGVGIFDKEGKTRQDEIDHILAGGVDPSRLIWEAPLKNQQQDLILRFGLNVNLGNVPPEEMLALEALRQGLRGDTLKRAYRYSCSSRS